jgi:2-keto-3-deoxy-L-rhamnonate aldolase RhmA
MRPPEILTSALVGWLWLAAPSAAQSHDRINPLVELHERGLPLFGLYAPRAVTRGPGGAASVAPKTPAQLASETLTFPHSDFVFDGRMEDALEPGLTSFRAYVTALVAAGVSTRSHPLVLKTQLIAPDPDGVARNIGRELDVGASVIVLVGVESAAEVRRGLEAMRYSENGGTRSGEGGDAPAYWGVPAAEYRDRADLWPLNPDGELINWTIVESREGLAHVREIAAVPGIGVLWPGAGTLRRVFSSTGPDGERVLDEEGWEAAIQQVLAACKEFDVPCGYPANADDIEMRMKQGFSVFVMGWGEGGFETVEMGRRLAGR